MGLWDRIKRGYKNIDSRVGGYLPGGVERKKKKSSTTKEAGEFTTGRDSAGLSPSQAIEKSAMTKGKTVGDSDRSSSSTSSTSNRSSSSRGTTTKKSLGQKIIPGQPAPDANGQGLKGSRGTTTKKSLGQKIIPGTQSADINKGYFGANPNIQERGVLTVTKDEAKKLKGTGRPYWIAESKTPRDALMEASFAGSTPQINRNINTKSLYEYNTQNILAGKENYRQYKDTVTKFKADPQSFEGKTGVTKTKSKGAFIYRLTPGYFDKTINYNQIQQDALTGAKKKFSSLPSSTRTRLNVAGYKQGVRSEIIGIGEFGGTMLVNMGVQTSNKEGVFEKRSFKFGGTLGEIRNYPPTQSTVGFLENPKGYLKQKGTAPDVLGRATVIIPLAFQGVKTLAGNVKSFGVVGGTIETAGSISPFKIKHGIYSQPLKSETSFKNIKSIKGTSNGITTRVYSGSSGNIKLSGVEKSAMMKGKTVGGGSSITQTPYTQISPGGRITTGMRTTINPYTFGSGGSGSVYGAKGNKYFTQVLTPSLKGGTSTVISSKGLTTYTSSTGTKVYSNLNKAYRLTGGSASKNVRTGVKDFISGRATPQYKTIYTGDTNFNLNTGSSSRDFIHAPSGKYKLTPQLSGREYDINAILSRGNKGYTSVYSTGNKGSGLKSAYGFGDNGISAVIPTPTTAKLPIPTKVIPFQPSPKLETSQGSQYAGLGMYEQTIGGTSPKSIQIPKTDTDTISAIIPQIGTGKKSRGKGKSRTITAREIIQKPKRDIVQKPKMIQVKKVKLQPLQSYARPTSFTYGGGASFAPYNIPTPILTPQLPLMTGGGKVMNLGNVKPQKSPSRYTPSFKALFFKIRGQAPRDKIKTGLRFRPITPGFSFTGRKKTIRVKKVKL